VRINNVILGQNLKIFDICHFFKGKKKEKSMKINPNCNFFG